METLSLADKIKESSLSIAMQGCYIQLQETSLILEAPVLESDKHWPTWMPKVPFPSARLRAIWP